MSLMLKKEPRTRIMGQKRGQGFEGAWVQVKNEEWEV
jgi:hypothetical protein